MPDNPASTAPRPVDAAHIIAQVHDYAIIALDASGTILSWDTGAERLVAPASA